MGNRARGKKKAARRGTSRAKVDRRKLPQDPATEFAADVVDGKIVAGPTVRAACARHLRDLESDHLIWDLEAVDYALTFFPKILRLSGTHEGKPFELLPWEKFVVASCMGWFLPEGNRRFRMAYVETAKGSGKSPLAAGIGLFGLVADGEPRAEVYAAATKKDQAKVLFRDAVSMVEQSPDLYERLLLTGGTEKNNIAYLNTGSFFRPISTEDRGKGQSGPRPHFALIDELHEHSTNAMVEFQRSGTKNRHSALIFMITNSGSDRQSVCYDYHDYGKKVCSGAVEDDSIFAYICDLDEGDDPFEDEACWIKANPSLPEIPGIQYLREQVTQAKGMPSKQNLVKRLNFCIWTDSVSAWIKQADWQQCEAELDFDKLRGMTACGGCDLSAKADLTALAWAVKQPDKTIDAWVDFFTPADTMKERAERDRVDYPLWAEQEHLVAVPGKSIDYSVVAQHIGQRMAEYEVAGINFDRWRKDVLERALEGEDVAVELWEFGQGFKDMAPAVDKLEERITNGTLRVQINPVLRWNVSGAVLSEDPAGNRKFNKQKATGRIDGVVALAMAVMAADSLELTPSPWEDPDYSIAGGE